MKENQLDADHIIFKRVFWTLKPCIDGFKFCKPVVEVDGTFLYEKIQRNVIGCSCARWPEQHITNYLRHVEGENVEAQFFFLQNPRRYVTPQDSLSLISYRRESIKSAYFTDGSGWNNNSYVHVYCIRHCSCRLTQLSLTSKVDGGSPNLLVVSALSLGS